MKVQIEVDDDLFLKTIQDSRTASFSKALDLLRLEVVSVKNKTNKRYPAIVLDSKLVAYEFAKILNIKTSKIFEVNKSIVDVSFKKNTVTKPMYENSGKGVFINENNKITYLNKNITFESEAEAKEFASKLIDKKIIKKDKWMSEELIKDSLCIARDVKFYLFYGEVGLVLESNRIPTLKRCWYDSNFEVVKTGKYDDSLFRGTAENLKNIADIAKSISLEIPVPFIRVDFLIIEDNVYLGEFTPVPGGYREFNSEWDKKLGELYINATTRICIDVANGKTFEKYASLNKLEKDIISKINSL